MFGNKDNGTSMPSALPSNALNSLVENTIVEGQVTSESDIRVDGTIRGSLICKAKVIIGPKGYIEGKIVCANAMIEGRFEGDLQVSELLNVRKTAVITGEINTKKLIVESGAIFNVSCRMGQQKDYGANKKGKTITKLEKKAS